MLGSISDLQVVRKEKQGFVLANKAGDEVLLPARYAPAQTSVQDCLAVFVYRDSAGRQTATTELPKAVLGEFAYLKVVDTSPAGAFVDLGIDKDLLVPRGEQTRPFQIGESRLVKICLDEQTDRLYGTGDVAKHVSAFATEYDLGDEVELMIVAETELGYKAIVDNRYWGLLYASEVFTYLEPGARMPGYVKHLREDRKLDLCLQPPGYAKVAGVEADVLEAVQEEGFLPLHAKSSPDEIYHRFGVSKKAFKLAVSALYRKRLIALEDDGIASVSQRDTDP